MSLWVRPWPATAWLIVTLSVGAAQAHVYAVKTLHGLVAEADLVLRARIVSAEPGPLRSTEPPGISRPGVDAVVLEVLKGQLDGPVVRFAQHGHGVVQFEPGDEALLFLMRIARSRELRAIGRSGAFEWVSVQEHADEYPLVPETRTRLLAAVHSYVEAGRSTGPEAQVAAVRSATLELLGSRDAALSSSALRDLVAAPEGLALVTSEDLPALLAILRDPQASMGVRVGLLTQLERRGLVEGGAHWLALLSDPVPPSDRVTAIRAAGVSGGTPARTRLIELLADPDERLAAAAAVALGRPGNSGAVAPLAATLASHEAASVRLSAIRGLGRIGSPSARDALEHTAESHPDARTRRRARAELRKPRASAGSLSTTE